MENASLKLELNSNFMACKEGQFDVVDLMVNNQFKVFSINLNVQHMNGMTQCGKTKIQRSLGEF